MISPTKGLSTSRSVSIYRSSSFPSVPVAAATRKGMAMRAARSFSGVGLLGLGSSSGRNTVYWVGKLSSSSSRRSVRSIGAAGPPPEYSFSKSFSKSARSMTVDGRADARLAGGACSGPGSCSTQFTVGKGQIGSWAGWVGARPVFARVESRCAQAGAKAAPASTLPGYISVACIPGILQNGAVRNRRSPAYKASSIL